MKRESRTVDRSDQVDSPSQRHLPLVDLLVDTRVELMELAVASGLKVLTTVVGEDTFDFVHHDLGAEDEARAEAEAIARRIGVAYGGDRPNWGPNPGDAALFDSLREATRAAMR